MPGMKHMKQDRRPVDGQDTLQTMQDKKMEQKKSGIYMDRMDGALPKDRVGKYYQDTNPKMEQATIKSMKKDLEGVAGFIGGGGPLKDAASSMKSAYNTYLKPTVDKAIEAKNKAFGANFFNDNVMTELDFLEKKKKQ
jgi:hypothetical protein